jgi:ribokinase
MALSFAKQPERGHGVTGLCVAGNLTIDVILRGVDNLPEWGQETICHDRTESVAGQAGNVAFAVAAMGIEVDVVSAVGADAPGSRIRSELSSSGVGVEGVIEVGGGTTPMTVALVRADGERAFVSDLGSLLELDIAATATQWLAARPASVVALVGTSNTEHVDSGAAVELFRLARQQGALTVFDPGWDPLGWSPATVSFMHAILAETDVFLPNRAEAEALTGEQDLLVILETLSELCPGTSVVKGGASGSYVIDDGQILNVHALSTVVDNAVGAGDVFNSGVIAAYVKGYDFLASLKLASVAASLYIGRRNNRFPEFRECEAAVNDVELSVVEF